jgi:tetratricopeptide (TPR) repeat protein
VKNLLDRCFDRLASDISAHGGRVDKIVGDEIMAVFGAPVTHEDDPERAVRAALQMQRNLVEHAEETGADVQMRIGVNTGEVLVGALRAGGDVTALGDVVNIAKRLQTTAPPGHVFVGPNTYDATKNVIGYEELGALAVKGREAPVGAWRAIEALGPPGARPGRPRTPLVGRKAEIGLIWHALATAVDHNRPHFLLLVGDAGMGKTALAEEAIELAQVQHDALVLEGRCLPYGEANPWWPVAEALRQACLIDPEDAADVAAEKCRKSIGTLLGTEDEGAEASRVSEGLLYLMGYGGSLNDLDPSRAREEVVRSIQISLAANARERPLVIVISELHWADQLVLDLVDAMFDRLRNLPIVLIATARPDLEERWTPKQGRHNIFLINLDPLNRKEAAEFVRQLLGTEPTAELVDLICERSGGNPLYINELVAMMGESGFLGGVGIGALAGHRVEGADLPATLRGLVSARIDALERPDRAVLEDASVVGRSGPIGALVALGEVRGEMDGRGRLADLAHKDFVTFDDTEYEFKSDLVREIAYETLTKGDRARRHASVADWLAKYAKRTEREDEHLERIAHHFAQAAGLVREVGVVDGVPPDVLEQALDWLDRAATHAESRDTIGVTVHVLEHALDLVDESRPALRARFLLSRARGRAGQRQMDAARADTDAVLEIAHKTGDKTLRAKALTVRGEIDQKDAAYDSSALTLEEAVRLWKEIGDRHGEAEALRLWGFTSLYRGENAGAEAAITEALEISRTLADRRGEAWALQNLAWAAFSRGENDLAEERLLASASVFEDIGDFGGRAWAYGLLGYVWFFKGRLEEAATVAEGGIAIVREIGDRWAYGMMVNLLSSVRMWQGRTKESLELARQGQRLFVEIDDKMGLVFSGMQLAWGSVLTGASDDGLAVALKYMPAASGVFAGGWAGVLAASTLHSLVGDTATAMQILDGHPAAESEPDLMIARALAQFVAGEAEAAYTSARNAWDSGPTDPGERANYGCILSLAAAAAGHAQEAVDAGEEVVRVGGSYLDRLRAHLGRAFGYAQLGTDDGVRSALDSAHKIVDATEDDLHIALVALAESAIASALGADLAPAAGPINSARDRLEELGVAWRPWEHAFRLAATGGRSEAVASPAGPAN